ncbi:MAG: hypothetical protein JRI22_12175 [Deltaproteobacteria bacterium]|nr:hypothetical protein [Deltaproteobacteria bacterium]
MKFKPKDVVFHREKYQALMGEMRHKNYQPLIKKEVLGRVNLRHRGPNPYSRDGKALVSFVVAQNGVHEAVLC